MCRKNGVVTLSEKSPATGGLYKNEFPAVCRLFFKTFPLKLAEKILQQDKNPLFSVPQRCISLLAKLPHQSSLQSILTLYLIPFQTTLQQNPESSIPIYQKLLLTVKFLLVLCCFLKNFCHREKYEKNHRKQSKVKNTK